MELFFYDTSLPFNSDLPVHLRCHVGHFLASWEISSCLGVELAKFPQHLGSVSSLLPRQSLKIIKITA